MDLNSHVGAVIQFSSSAASAQIPTSSCFPSDKAIYYCIDIFIKSWEQFHFLGIYVLNEDYFKPLSNWELWQEAALLFLKLASAWKQKYNVIQQSNCSDLENLIYIYLLV